MHEELGTWVKHEGLRAKREKMVDLAHKHPWLEAPTAWPHDVKAYRRRKRMQIHALIQNRWPLGRISL